MAKVYIFYFSAMCSLLHTSACLLIRPSLLNMVVSQKSSTNKAETKTSIEELQRVRRLSSTDHDTGKRKHFFCFLATLTNNDFMFF